MSSARGSLPAGHWRTAGYAVSYGACLLELGRAVEAEGALVRAHGDLVAAGRRAEADRAASLLVEVYERLGRPDRAAAYDASAGGR